MSGTIFTFVIFLLLAGASSKLSSKMKKAIAAAQTADDVEEAVDSADVEFAEDCFISESDTQRVSADKRFSMDENEPQTVEEQVEKGFDFDLRKAVIYQTILENEHIGIR